MVMREREALEEREGSFCLSLKEEKKKKKKKKKSKDLNLKPQ